MALIYVIEYLDYKEVESTYVAASEVATLKHKLRDHTMEARANVAGALLTVGAENTKVLSGLGNDIVEELEVDAARLGCLRR